MALSFRNFEMFCDENKKYLKVFLNKEDREIEDFILTVTSKYPHICVKAKANEFNRGMGSGKFVKIDDLFDTSKKFIVNRTLSLTFSVSVF